MWRYEPKFSNGQKVSLSWPLRLFRWCNHISWPLEDGVSERVRRIESVAVFIGFIIVISINDAELRYLRIHINEIDDLLTGIPTYIILWEMMFRSFTMAWRKEQTKKQLRKFYAEIYIQQKNEPVMFGKIQHQMIPLKIMAMMYWVAYLTLCVGPIINRSKELLYKMVPLFDVTPLHIYLPVVLTNVWTGLITVTTIFGEINLLGELLMHLNARYNLLKHDLSEASEQIRCRSSPTEMSQRFGHMIANILEENIKLNAFAAEVEQETSFRLFVLFSLSTVSMCALVFKSYTNPIANVAYVFWFLAKFLELMTIGNLGTVLHTTTNGLSSMYYECSWEDVLMRSADTTENVRLMKQIVMAIQFNEKPFSLKAMKYFSVSLNTVVKILQATMSYFTFLLSKR